jgi:hypothetical protein
MFVRSRWPLLVWLLLAGVLGFGLVARQSEPYNRYQPSIAPYMNRQAGESPALYTRGRHSENERQESRWIEQLFEKPTDTLLVMFNGLLVLFTALLFAATSGLFKETAGLRAAADQQAFDMKESIIAAKKSAAAAEKAALATEKSVENATAALEHAKQVAEADQRPWINIEIAPARCVVPTFPGADRV